MTAASPRDVVVIGASAGGVVLLRSLVAALRPGLGASFFVTIHRLGSSPSTLAHVLGRHSVLPVEEPFDGDRIAPDVIYLAPPDLHLRVDGRKIRLDRGPKEHHTRPAIDPMFVSASISYAERTVGVLMSGNLSDGVAGLIAIKARGGVTLVQDPSEAEWPAMPRNALLYDHVDVVFQANGLPALLRRLVRGETVSNVLSTPEGPER